MKTLPLLVLLSAATLVAEESSPTDRSPILAPPASAPAPAPRPHAMSATMAARLAAVMPQFSAPPDHAAASKSDAREPDLPRNDIIRLPQFIVRDRKYVPPESEVLTGRGRTELAVHRYLTETDRALNAFTLPLFGWPKEARARFMQYEDERLERMARYHDLIELTRLTDPAAARKLKSKVDDTFMRK